MWDHPRDRETTQKAQWAGTRSKHRKHKDITNLKDLAVRFFANISVELHGSSVICFLALSREIRALQTPGMDVYLWFTPEAKLSAKQPAEV